MNNLYRANYKKQDNLHSPDYNNYELCRLDPSENKKDKNNKLNLKTLKCNTCSSLKEVECFLNNLDKFWHYVKLYKLLR